MEEAARRFAPLVDGVEFGSPHVPVISNYDGRAHGQGREIADNLVNQLCHPVRWEECVAEISSVGVDAYVEVGPGKVLSGLIRRCLPGSTTFNVEDPGSLAGLMEFLGGTSYTAATAGER